MQKLKPNLGDMEVFKFFKFLLVPFRQKKIEIGLYSKLFHIFWNFLVPTICYDWSAQNKTRNPMYDRDNLTHDFNLLGCIVPYLY